MPTDSTSATTQASIKTTLRQKILEQASNIRIARAMERQNIDRTLGVGNFDNFLAEFNVEYQNSRTGKDPVPSARKLKKVSREKIITKLV